MEQGADINPEELLVFAQRAVSIDPYREGAHRHLLRALALMGRRSDALTLYRERSEEHTSELQSLMRISYAVFCLKKKTNKTTDHIVSIKHAIEHTHRTPKAE